jgi:hypothetical protein
MEDQRKSDYFWGNILECTVEFVPDEAGFGVLGCIAAAFVVAGIIWAASRLWESLLG